MRHGFLPGALKNKSGSFGARFFFSPWFSYASGMKTRQALFFVVVFTLLALERHGYCDEPGVKDIPAGTDKIVGVKEGDKAPFTGQLFEPATALRWANWLQQYKLRLAVDVEAEKKICAADKELGQKKLDIEQEKNKAITDDLRKQVATKDARITDLEKAADSPPFYRTVWFGAVLGATAAFLAVGLTAWGLSSTN